MAQFKVIERVWEYDDRDCAVASEAKVRAKFDNVEAAWQFIDSLEDYEGIVGVWDEAGKRVVREFSHFYVSPGGVSISSFVPLSEAEIAAYDALDWNHDFDSDDFDAGVPF